MRDGAFAGAVLRLPLLGACRALRQLPLVFEQVFEEVVAPLRRGRRPGHLETAGDRVRTDAGLIAALPAETLLLEIAALRFGADVLGRRRGAVRLAERVPTGD